MKPDEFEKELQRQPLRRVPPGWRADILRAAREESRSQVSALNSQRAPWWRELLWPSPQAWAGLAAVWIVVLILNWTAPRGDSPMVADTTAPNPGSTATNLAEQRRELARLLDNTFEPAPTRKSSAPPGPRSERVAPPRV